MLSFASFGVNPCSETKKVAKAVELVRQRNPKIEVEGEIQADIALSPTLRQRDFPFSSERERQTFLFFQTLQLLIYHISF